MSEEADSPVVHEKFVVDDEGCNSEIKSVEEKNTSINPYEFLKLTKNPDGSLTRDPIFPLSPVILPCLVSAGDQQNISSEDAKKVKSVSKDVTLSKNKKTWIRIHRPDWPPAQKLPLILYFHGGGFIFCSADSAPYDAYCSDIAAQLPAVVANVEYRTAPEHRLPAAYDDAVEALEWLRDNVGKDEWLRDYTDPGRCFLHGSSAGGNIVYHLALKAQQLKLGQLVVRGLIFNQPFFGGSGRMESELRYSDGPLLTLPINDLMWELALPVGSTRDHKYSNPMGSIEEPQLLGLLPRCLVIMYQCDPLVDRQRQFVKMMEPIGVQVMTQFHEGGYHAVELLDPLQRGELVKDVQNFVSAVSLTI